MTSNSERECGRKSERILKMGYDESLSSNAGNVQSASKIVKLKYNGFDNNDQRLSKAINP